MVHKAIELEKLSPKQRALLDGEGVWIISPKYDGCHAIFAFDEGQHVGTYSRTGEAVLSMDHIARSLLDHYDLTQGRTAICGEAWMMGTEFNVISGKFRRQSPQPDLMFVPFDIVPFDYDTEGFGKLPLLLGQYNNMHYPTGYARRLESLVKRRVDAPSNVLRPRFVIEDQNIGFENVVEIASWYARDHKARTDSYFDGAVLAKGNGKYIVGAGTGGEFIKVKPLISHSVVVEDVTVDFGAKTGKTTLVLGFTLDGKKQKVSTGITQTQADEWAEYPSLIVNCTIEVEAMGYTVNGLLREPRFKGVRTDA